MICPGRACPSASCQYLLWCKVFVTLSASQTLYVTLNQHLLSSFACKIIIKLVFYQYIKFLMVKNTLFDKYYWSTVRWNHCHQLMGHDIPSLTYFFFFRINSCPNNCSEHGKCTTSLSVPSRVYCECDKYWKGEACDIPYCKANCGSPDHGYCDLTGEKLCVCNDSWQGKLCLA